LQRIIEQLQVVIGFDSASVTAARGGARDHRRAAHKRTLIGMTFNLTPDCELRVSERRAVPIGARQATTVSTPTSTSAGGACR
jgi:hypothetical protein